MKRIKPILNKIKRPVAWVIVALILLLPPVFLANPAGYLPILGFLFLSLISRLYLEGLKRSIQWAEGQQTEFCRRGDKQDFGLKVRNKGPLVFPSLQVQLCLSDLFGGVDSALDAEMTLGPFQSRQMDMNVSFTHIGEYTVSVRRMRIGSLMGVLSKDMGGGAEHVIQVLPHIWKIRRLPLSHQVNNENSKARQTTDKDGMDYIGVREYSQGDPIRSIHWKLSAHTNGYMTKQMVTIGMTGLSIILDLYSSREDAKERMDLYDGLIEGACALCSYALDNHLEHDLMFFDREGMKKSRSFQKKQELDRMILDMPTIVSDRTDYPVEQFLYRAAIDLYGKNNVAIITSEITTEMIELIIRIHLRGRYPILFLVQPKGLSENEERRQISLIRPLDSYGIPWHTYSDSSILEGRDFG